MHWGGGWGTRMEDGTEQTWEWKWLQQIIRIVFHSQQPSSLMQVCALPVPTAVIQLDKCVNGNRLILTHCSFSETGYLTNECQMLSPMYELYCYCMGSVMTLKLNNEGIVFMLPFIMAMINPD